MIYSPEQWRDLGQYFSFAGEEFFYCTSFQQGSDNTLTHRPDPAKPTLLLIHGFPSCSWDWSPMWQQLSQHFNLIATDMLGFGLSSKNPNADYRIGFQADMLQALLKQLGISEYMLIAHDYGDTVAQELLARDLDNNKITSAILLNGGLFPETHRPLWVQKLLLTPLGALASVVMNYKKFKRSFDRICAIPLPEQELTTLWHFMEVNQGQKVMHKLIHYIRERRQYRDRWVGALQNTQASLCLINGTKDPISGQHMVERYRQLIGDENIVELNQLGHYPQLEDCQAVLHAILNFLQITPAK